MNKPGLSLASSLAPSLAPSLPFFLTASLPRVLKPALLCAALLSTLSGCVEMMVGSAVVGAVATADRRTFGAQTEDKSIALKADIRLQKLLDATAHVSVDSFNRKALLTGEVKDEATKAAVERTVRGIDGVQAIVNELEVAPPATYTARSMDALITTKVKASLIDMKTISANSFKVITARSNVYLMGRVSQREGQIATDVARGVSGVQKVVKVFEYLSDEELQALTAPPKPSSGQ